MMTFFLFNKNVFKKFSYTSLIRISVFLFWCQINLSIQDENIIMQNDFSNEKIRHGVTKDGQVTETLLDYDDMFFEVLQPADIQYTYRVRMAKDFGSFFVYKNVLLVPSEPYDACHPIRNNNEVRGRVALVKRGECVFLDKCINAEKAGALAIIVTDNDFSSDFLLDMIGDDSKRVCNIPCLFMTWKDGIMIRKSLDKNNLKYALINLPLNLTLKAEHKVLKKAPWSLL